MSRTITGQLSLITTLHFQLFVFIISFYYYYYFKFFIPHNALKSIMDGGLTKTLIDRYLKKKKKEKKTYQS